VGRRVQGQDFRSSFGSLAVGSIRIVVCRLDEPPALARLAPDEGSNLFTVARTGGVAGSGTHLLSQIWCAYSVVAPELSAVTPPYSPIVWALADTVKPGPTSANASAAMQEAANTGSALKVCCESIRGPEDICPEGI
jgi:hypothetical protein